MFDVICKICKAEFKFDEFGQVSAYFKKIINLVKQMNYSRFQEEKFKGFEDDLQSLLMERKIS